MKNFIIIGIGIVVVAAAVWFYQSQDTWQGVYYPGGDTFNESYSPVFKTYEECARWGYGLVTSESDEFECGKNCKAREVIEGEFIQVCEETF